MLSGYKTYIFAVLVGAVAAGQYLGLVDEATAKVLTGLFTGGALFALRAGVAKSQ